MPKEYPQQEYNKRWTEKNKAHRSYLSSRSSARSFIKNKATAEDLKELKNLISEREKIFKLFLKRRQRSNMTMLL